MRTVDQILRSLDARAKRVVEGKLEGLYDAIADGLRTPGLLGKIEALEAEDQRLAAELARPAPSPIRLHVNLADHYRQRVSALSAALKDPETGDDARQILRKLTVSVTVDQAAGGRQVPLEGEITQLIGLGMTGPDAGTVP